MTFNGRVGSIPTSGISLRLSLSDSGGQVIGGKGLCGFEQRVIDPIARLTAAFLLLTRHRWDRPASPKLYRVRRRFVKLQLQLDSQHPIPVRTAAGNGEERAAQINRIQERLSRLHQSSQHIASEVAALTTDIEKLADHASPSAPPKRPESD